MLSGWKIKIEIGSFGLCEIIEREPNLIVLAGPKPIRFICWSTMVDDIFLNFYANFKKYHSYAPDWNSVREENNVTTKRYFKQFYKANVFLSRYNKIYFRSINCYSYVDHLIYENLHNIISSFIDKKKLKWRFLDHPWLWWPKIFEIINWNPYRGSWFIANSGKSINLKTSDDPFLFILTTFLQHIVCGIISNIATVNMQWELR